MKVKAIININDLQDKVFRPVGSVFECNEERAKYLLQNKAIEIIEEPKKEIAKKELKETFNELSKAIGKEIKIEETETKPKKKKKK